MQELVVRVKDHVLLKEENALVLGTLSILADDQETTTRQRANVDHVLENENVPTVAADLVIVGVL